MTQLLTIRSLRPNVTQQEAIQHFCGGMSGWLRRAALGPLRFLADVYIPFDLFQVDIKHSGRVDSHLLAVDAVNGLLDPFEFNALPSSTELAMRRTRNNLEPKLNEARIAQLSIDKARRLLFSRGFFRVRDLKITASRVAETFYVPYWVGFLGANDEPHLAVMDATRRRFEGAKVRRLLEEWLNVAT